MKTLACLVAVSAAVAMPASAGEMVNGCVFLELGDSLSVRETATTVECSDESVSDRRDLTFASLDVWYQAVRPRGEANWMPAVVLNALYMRGNDSLGVDGRGQATIERLRVLVGDEVFELTRAGHQEPDLGCRRSGLLGSIVGGCFYRAMATFTATQEFVAAARSADAMTFRVFMDTGEEVDGTMPAGELIRMMDSLPSD